MRRLAIIGLLILSNIFMTFIWHGHPKPQETKISMHWLLVGIMFFSWKIAFLEYKNS